MTIISRCNCAECMQAQMTGRPSLHRPGVTPRDSRIPLVDKTPAPEIPKTPVNPIKYPHLFVDEEGRHHLAVDEKWSISYRTDHNDRPLYWWRYKIAHAPWPSLDNRQLAMFYSLLEVARAA